MRIYIVLLSVLFMVSSCDPFHTMLTEEDVNYYHSDQIKDTPFHDTLKVMTWNIKFGGGRIDFFFDCYGERVVMTEQEVIDNLSGLASKINQYNPDILFLQEVDMDSKRSSKVNQLQWLLDNTSLNHGVFASQWKADYVPSDGIGRINSGNAILCKWELSDAVRVSLPLFEEQNAIVRYFYLKRNILHAKLKQEGREIDLVTTHLAAYSHDGTKKKQMDILIDTLASLSSKDKIFILGGDFNCLPPGSEKVKDFPDAACVEEEFSGDDYSGEEDYMTPFYKYTSAIYLDDYKTENSKYFTHTTNSPDRGAFWSRKLDYIFTNGKIVPGSGLTHQNEIYGGMNTMKLSDHCPVSFEFIAE